VIRLFTTVYSETDEKRRSEYRKCFELNSACKFIDEIRVLSEGGEEALPQSKKIHVRQVSQRPTYQRYFDWITELAADSDITIIANSDIFFDPQLAFFRHWKMPQNTVFALSRWDYETGKLPRLFDRNDSQDAWIFRGRPTGVSGSFPIGMPRCDNRIAAEFERAGYKVLNPSFSLRCFHVHESTPRPYLDAAHSEEIPLPYKYVWPHNLFGPLETMVHNLKHRDSQLYWRFDRRKFAQWLPIRLLSKMTRVFQVVA